MEIPCYVIVWEEDKVWHHSFFAVAKGKCVWESLTSVFILCLKKNIDFQMPLLGYTHCQHGYTHSFFEWYTHCQLGISSTWLKPWMLLITLVHNESYSIGNLQSRLRRNAKFLSLLVPTPFHYLYSSKLPQSPSSGFSYSCHLQLQEVSDIASPSFNHLILHFWYQLTTSLKQYPSALF